MTKEKFNKLAIEISQEKYDKHLKSMQGNVNYFDNYDNVISYCQELLEEYKALKEVYNLENNIKEQ